MRRTLVESARDGAVPPQVTEIAAAEGIDEDLLRERIASGSAVIMQRCRRVVGIGCGLRTKVNVNLGSSTIKVDVAAEIAKARIAEEFGADTITDLSMGGDINAIRKEIFAHTSLPITTVPIYQAVVENRLRSVTAGDILATMRAHAEQGVSSLVVHCVNRKMLEACRKKRRILGIVSKGGSMTLAYMVLNRCENPFIEIFDDILALCRKYDIVLSLGNTARSGCIHDRRDAIQREEIQLNTELAYRAHDEGVQVIVEGCGGHIRIDRIPRYIKTYKKTSPFPLFVAGRCPPTSPPVTII